MSIPYNNSLLCLVKQLSMQSCQYLLYSKSEHTTLEHRTAWAGDQRCDIGLTAAKILSFTATQDNLLENGDSTTRQHLPSNLSPDNCTAPPTYFKINPRTAVTAAKSIGSEVNSGMSRRSSIGWSPQWSTPVGCWARGDTTPASKQQSAPSRILVSTAALYEAS